MVKYCEVAGKECYGTTELPLLFDISSMINNSRNIKESLHPILKLISDYIHAEKVFLSILNRENSKIVIEVAHGLSNEVRAKVKYRVGEGIIGEVVKTGIPRYIEKIEKDRRFLNKTQSQLTSDNNEDLSFLCVPVKTETKILGTLSITRTYDPALNPEEVFRLLTIIGSMIGKAVKGRQDRLEEVERLREENARLQNQIKDKFKPVNMVGNSGLMKDVYELVERVSQTNATVLIRGESGVGKELVADAIHYNSLRAEKPFIKVNCSALPDSLIESELFGHEKGAFTGADMQRKGRFELANGGTIFLDEIGDVPHTTQVKLLRILQEKEFERLGGTQTIKCDVRIIAATNRKLEEQIEKGEFREDLYYRLNVFPVFIPSLRERINDIPALVDFFIQRCNKENHTTIKRISSSAIDMLMVYHWPGNIRELENCIERAAIMSIDGVIRATNLPPTLQTAQSSGTEQTGTLQAVVSRIEKQLIIETLVQTKGNLTRCAEKLGITERMMGTRVRKYKIDPKRYKVKSHENE